MESQDLYTIQKKHAHHFFFEAEIINLLAGSLARAHYVAMRDGKIINPQLVNVNALLNYGGSSGSEVISENLDCFIDSSGVGLSNYIIRLYF